MDVYPLNLILAVATASATIFFGFLPTKNIRSDFFAREILRAAIAWIFVALISPPAILHFPLIIAFLCLGSWRQFRLDNAFSGKMWLILASGLGISIGVVLILAVTPRAYPPGWPQINQTLLLASIYLGGGVIGLAYVCYVLTKSASTGSGVTHGLVQRYIRLLTMLTFTRTTVLLTLIFFTSEMRERPMYREHPGSITMNMIHLLGHPIPDISFGYAEDIGISHQLLLFLGLAISNLPILALLAQRAAQLGSRILPTRFLVAICLVGFFAEILARFLLL